MSLRVKILTALTILSAIGCIKLVSGPPAHDWVRFIVYLAFVLMTAGQKVAMPNGKGSMSVNFPFILVGLLQLSPLQAVALAAVSVFAQCRFPVIKPFTIVQISFNLGNVVVSTSCACIAYAFLIKYGMEMAPALSLAATVYFFANTIPVALAIGWSNGEKPFNLWRHEYPWYLPFYLVGAFVAAVVQLISIRLGWMTSLLIIPIIYTIHRAYREQIASIAARQTHLEETKALHLRTIEALAMAIEAKDQNTHDHLVRVRVYVSEIGRIMGLDSAQMEALVTAAFLHDIGKLAVPEHIVNKPGKLTPEEFDKIKIHPVVGADILDRVRFPYPVTPIVRSHHEAWDGSGYPEGLKGEDIPIGARILTAVDCFDAMASDRPYRRALPLDGAMAHVKSLAGKQFDPNVVRVLEEHYHELETLARHESQSPSPLQIEPSSTRGTAPGAGFERESAVTAAMEEAAAAAAAAPARTQPSFNQSSFPREALTLISAASKEAQAIFEISRSLGNSIRANETASAMSTSLRNWIACDCFAIYLKKGDYLIPHYMDGDGISSFAPSPILSGEGLSGWVFKSGKPIVNGNPEVEPNYIGTSGSPGQMRSALSLPLYEPGKEIFGVLTLYSTAADAFSRENLRIMMALESKLSLALQNALIFRDADNGARLDYLTQLPNIRQFSFQMEVELSNARRSGESLGVVVCDLNSFKAVNDRHGHAVGDKLLRAIADGFKETCRKEDTVARMGGDEFVFLLPGADSQNCATKLLSLEMTVREVCASLQIGIDVSTSAGAAFFPEDADSAEALLDLADHRMYSHKRSSAPKNRAKRDFFVPYTSAT